MKAKVKKYFFPKGRLLLPPRTTENHASALGADREELLLIMAGKARNARHARELLTLYSTESAVDVLSQLPKRRKKTFMEKILTLLQRLAGHETRNPYRVPSDDGLPIRTFYK